MEWGHFAVGGERLKCEERIRLHKDRNVPFFFEPLSGLRVDEWWECDISAIQYNMAKLEEFWRTYAGEPRYGWPTLVFEGGIEAKLPYGKAALFKNVVKDLQHEKGVFQKPWLDLPFEVVVMIRSKEFSRQLKEWPTGNDLRGQCKGILLGCRS